MRVLIITGGSSGIGQATALLFVQNDWHVYELSRHGNDNNGIVHLSCDVTNESDCAEAVAEVVRREGHIDVLISNAGFGISGPIEFTRTEDAKRLFDVNFFGALNISRAVLPQMRQQRYGRILFTSSVAGLLPVPYQSFYSASKSAVNALALSMQNEVRQFGIKVACLLPGDVSTGFTDAREKNMSGEEIYTNAGKAVEAMEKDERGGMRPEKMARIFYRMATKRHIQTYYVGGTDYKILWLLGKILPVSLVNRIEGLMYS
ncbi:MAG: SDR family oxidoreductase [Paludibacteraceae bacterium]|nr:SDR family oxidoreductase [Paludibacteraceae bacterium]